MNLLEPADAAEQLATTPSHVLTLMRTGKLAYVRVGRHYRIRQVDLDEFIEASVYPRRDPEVLTVRPRLLH